MRTLLAAALLLGLLLPVGVEAKPFSAGRSETSARKAKAARRSDNAPLVVDGASSKRSKRRADDPVLRRYGKRPQDVAYVEYDADKTSKKSAKKSRKASDEDILVIEDAPAKKPSKSKAAKKAQADEEILIIEETPAAKQPVKATKVEKPAKKSKAKIADDDDEMPAKSKAKKSIVDDDDDDDDDEITITLD